MYRNEFQGFVWDSIERDYLADIEDDEEYYSILEQYKESTTKDSQTTIDALDEDNEDVLDDSFWEL